MINGHKYHVNITKEHTAMYIFHICTPSSAYIVNGLHCITLIEQSDIEVYCKQNFFTKTVHSFAILC